MLEVVLVEPQIATNTGNIIRLCANAGTRLHLVRPLGFDARRRRAAPGWTRLPRAHGDTDLGHLGRLPGRARWGAALVCHDLARPSRRYDHVAYQSGDVVAFGCEADGLGEVLLAEFPAAHRLHIPMRPSNRSLNLANAVSIVAYEAWRQHDFAGAATGTFQESLRARPG